MSEQGHRLPPRQRVVRSFPVMLSMGVPKVDLEQWRLRIFGLVEEEVSLTYEQIRSLPVVRRRCDFHCVTGWSRLDDEWEGVWAREVLALAKPKPNARFVMAHSCDGYTTNLDLEVVLNDGMLVRAVRVIVDIGLHCKGMSFVEAVQWLVQEAHLERANAEAEVRRYTASPTQPLSYLTGKQAILQLREEVQRREGNQFSLRRFHDRLLQAGGLPMPLVRKLVLGG